MTVVSTAEDDNGKGLYRMRCERCSAVTGWLSLPADALHRYDLPCLACNGQIDADRGD